MGSAAGETQTFPQKPPACSARALSTRLMRFPSPSRVPLLCWLGAPRETPAQDGLWWRPTAAPLQKPRLRRPTATGRQTPLQSARSGLPPTCPETRSAAASPRTPLGACSHVTSRHPACRVVSGHQLSHAGRGHTAPVAARKHHVVTSAPYAASLPSDE